VTDVRDIYRSHEGLVDGAVERLLPGALARSRWIRIRTRALAAAAAVAVVAIIAGIGFAVAADRSTNVAGPDHRGLPAGYRLISSLGVQIAVPDAWTINDIPTCSHNVGTVIRGAGASAGCKFRTPGTNDYAEISTRYAYEDVFGPLPTVSTSPVKIDGVSATRSTVASGGYHYGWIVIKSRDVAVYVRAHDNAELTAILGSLRLVTTDFLGCPVQPPSKRPAAPSDNNFIDLSPRSIAVCSYVAEGTDRRLNASALMTAQASTALAAEINSEPPGADPARSRAACSYAAHPVRTDMLLIVTSANGARQRISVSLFACAGGRLDNGRSDRQLTDDLAIQIMRAAGVTGPLPG
jgi:hypothetical protein